jgi:cytochrome c oxidase subunit II
MKPNHKRRLLLIVTGAGGLGPLAALVSAQPEEQVIKVVAKRFDYTPSEIRVKRGVPVTLELTTLDVPMGFNAPDFKVRTDILPGKVSKLHFTPAKTGEFVFHCDIFCGDGHESMDGVIVVTA